MSSPQDDDEAHRLQLSLIEALMRKGAEDFPKPDPFPLAPVPPDHERFQLKQGGRPRRC